tara:strand:+ start:5490 stop:6056 length:567 start_codon:yes stop_codon:yes gene_type:complete
MEGSGQGQEQERGMSKIYKIVFHLNGVKHIKIGVTQVNPSTRRPEQVYDELCRKFEGVGSIVVVIEYDCPSAHDVEQIIKQICINMRSNIGLYPTEIFKGQYEDEIDDLIQKKSQDYSITGKKQYTLPKRSIYVQPDPTYSDTESEEDSRAFATGCARMPSNRTTRRGWKTRWKGSPQRRWQSKSSGC